MEVTPLQKEIKFDNPFGEMNWEDVDKLRFFLVYPLGLIFSFLIHLTRFWSNEGKVANPAELPKDAIIYAFHPEVYLYPCTPSFWKPVFPKLMGLGNHWTVSYLASVAGHIWKMYLLRYSKNSRLSSRDQVVQACKEYPDLYFGLRTDAGGPYYKIRSSLVDIAIKSNRPLVALRQRASNALVLGDHHFALPFSKVNLAISKPIYPDELKRLSKKEAVALVQDQIDRCMDLLKDD